MFQRGYLQRYPREIGAYVRNKALGWGPVSTLKESPKMFNIYDLKFGREAEGRIQVSVSFRPLQDRYAITVAAQGRP